MNKKYKGNDINLVKPLKTSDMEKAFEAARERHVMSRGAEISADFSSEVMRARR